MLIGRGIKNCIDKHTLFYAFLDLIKSRNQHDATILTNETPCSFHLSLSTFRIPGASATRPAYCGLHAIERGELIVPHFFTSQLLGTAVQAGRCDSTQRTHYYMK